MADSLWTVSDGRDRTASRTAVGQSRWTRCRPLGVPAPDREAIGANATVVYSNDHLDRSGWSNELAPGAERVSHEWCARVVELRRCRRPAPRDPHLRRRADSRARARASPGLTSATRQRRDALPRAPGALRAGNGASERPVLDAPGLAPPQLLRVTALAARARVRHVRPGRYSVMTRAEARARNRFPWTLCTTPRSGPSPRASPCGCSTRWTATSGAPLVGMGRSGRVRRSRRDHGLPDRAPLPDRRLEHRGHARRKPAARMRDFDVVVLGAGLSGGLTAAAYLQKAARQGRPRRAGDRRWTLLPLVRPAARGAVRPLARELLGLSPAIHDLGLEELGYALRVPEVTFAVLDGAGERTVFYPDAAKTHTELARHSAVDADTFRTLFGRLAGRTPQLLRSAIFTPHPDRAAFDEALALSAEVLDTTPSALLETTGVDLVEQLFHSDHVRRTVAALPALNLFGDLLEPGQGALTWLWTLALRSAVAQGSPVPRKGPRTVVRSPRAARSCATRSFARSSSRAARASARSSHPSARTQRRRCGPMER